MGLFSSIIKNITGKDNPLEGTGLDNMGRQIMNQAESLGNKLNDGAKKVSINVNNAYKRLQPINDKNYPDFQQNPGQYLGQEGILWFVRKDLEAARYYCTGGKEGYGEPSRLKSAGIVVNTPLFQQLREDINKAEEKVKEMEQAKGYEFVRCENNTIFFREISTGRELSADESNGI